MKVFMSSFLFLFVIVSKGQVKENPPVSNLPSSLIGLSITGHAYPDSALGDVHKSFMVRYGVSKSLQLELQGFYDTYILSERFRSSVLAKVYLNERLYLFGGIEAEIATENAGVGQTPYRIGFVTGLGYDVDPNLMIELKANIQMNNPSMGAFGEKHVVMPAALTLGSKWKF
ncbi:hypothetical protein [Maribacter stanieri]|uniref:Outer membrane protein beta-barrel domain-containing protein n=1 Tax=Maribacter stanieri TaxID=440514 RepID=A0A1I6KJQ0_9FLAO|nr:hypothetical protein [Maribacter stanieri]SFR91384.1 hypothetical protein SAMN04488010_3738 [Maribacter stanieri]